MSDRLELASLISASVFVFFGGAMAGAAFGDSRGTAAVYACLALWMVSAVITGLLLWIDRDPTP